MLVALTFGLPTAKADWPDFRGPWGNGHVSAPGDTKPIGLPLQWSETNNIKWKTEIPFRGWSTPVILGSQVWLTTATEAGNDYFALCLDKENGKILFNEKVFHTDNPEPLGNGASMCAMHQRKSVATTMGFTALDGLMMGTRCGAIDPGVLLHLLAFHRMDAAALTKLLYKESGLLGVSGLSQDMRALLDSAAPEAAEAVELFCYRIARELGSLAAALGGLDALVFTAGIGEHAAPVRESVCRQAGWLGVKLDAEANTRHDARISTPGSAVDVLVLPTNEEWMIAQHAAALVS